MKIRMKQILLFAIALIASAGFVGCGASAVAIPENMTGKVYTQVNMWENKGHISSVNYSVGRKIPVNTEVKILSMTSKNIVFVEAKYPDIKLTIDNIEKYSMTDTAALSKLYFAPKKVNLRKFTKKEQEFINTFNGFYKTGISKEAMIVARGYPPKHKTPTMKYDSWSYWRNKWVSKTVEFKNNKTVSVNGQALTE
jgi:hypothetical protein